MIERTIKFIDIKNEEANILIKRLYKYPRKILTNLDKKDKFD